MKLLKKPFPAFTDRRQKLLSALAFGLFVGLFLAYFKPFGLHGLGDTVFWIAAGYGAITTVCMLLAQWVLPLVFPGYYSEDEWNTGREISQIMVNVLLIALANWIFSAALGFFKPDFYSLLQFLVFTAMIGVFPVSIQVLLRQNNYHRRFSESSAAINSQLSGRPAPNNVSQPEIVIVDEYGKPALALGRQVFIAAESADNYVKVYYEGDQGPNHEMLRTSLSALEDALADDNRFFRVHRSWLINLQRVDKVEGNARGYLLQLDSFSKQIPVARSRIASFNDALRGG
jgi:hypothetical protein